MNLADLIRATELRTRGLGVTQRDIIDALNEANTEISQKLRIPRYFREIDAAAIYAASAVGEFTLPVTTRVDGLLGMSFAPRPGFSYRLRLITINEAEMEFPDWTDTPETGNPVFMIYDPGNATAPLRPSKVPTTGTYYYEAVEIPTVMSALSDTPLGGMLESYHLMLAHYAASILGNTNEWAFYERKFKEASGRVGRGSTPVVHAVRASLSRNIRQGRR